MRFRFTKSVIATPIADFFSYRDGNYIPFLVGDNMELNEVYTQSIRPVSKIIETYV
jgi:hypothetical protein